MKSSTFKMASLIVCECALLTVSSVSQADLHQHAYGLKKIKADERKKLHHRRISKVRLNALGVSRKSAEMNLGAVLSAGVPSGEEEIQLEIGGSESSSLLNNTIDADGNGVLGSDSPSLGSSSAGTNFASSGSSSSFGDPSPPTSVDNSSLVAFPPIIDQGQQGSCVAFATTYYQLSHETCLARGCNNKATRTSVFSPRWTYNMINDGTDGGSTFYDAYQLLYLNGAIGILQLPYSDSDYLSWDTNSNDWKNAISYRLSSPVISIPNLDGYVASNTNYTNAMSNVKNYLANGHVLTFGTYIDSWVLGLVGTNPTPGSANTRAGQTVGVYMNGQESGGHAMTIVGYDDTVWVDINANGSVDTGELGAFKVANSWGTSGAWFYQSNRYFYGNAGFIWVAYDALRSQSAVTGVTTGSSGRESIFQAGTVFAVSARSSYSPKMTAEFTLNTNARNKISIAVGTSATGTHSPTSQMRSGALNYDGGSYGFSGTTSALDATFYVDMTDLVSGISDNTRLNYYLLATSSSNSAYNLKNYFINDTAGASLQYPGQQSSGWIPLPTSVRNTTVILEQPFTYSTSLLSPVAAIASNANLGTVTFDSTGSSDPDGTITQYLWDFGDGAPQTTGAKVTHSYLSSGTFTVTLSLTDSNSLTASASSTLTVQTNYTLTPPQGLTALVK